MRSSEHLDVTRFLVERKADLAARTRWHRAHTVAVPKLIRCVAGMVKLPSNSPSVQARATLQRICAALERRSDVAAAHRAHQSQMAPPLVGQMQSHPLVVLHAARHCRARRNKIALECFSSNAKNPSCSHRISRIALTSRVSRLVLFKHHTSRSLLLSQFLIV